MNISESDFWGRGCLVWSPGVPRHGQLGVEPVVAAKQMLRSLVLTVEDAGEHQSYI